MGRPRPGDGNQPESAQRTQLSTQRTDWLGPKLGRPEPSLTGLIDDGAHHGRGHRPAHQQVRDLNPAEDVEALVLAAVWLEVERRVFLRGDFEKVGMPVREEDVLTDPCGRNSRLESRINSCRRSGGHRDIHGAHRAGT